MSIIHQGQKLEISLEFLGAANGVVTGSCNLVTITRNGETRKILVDYGLFQGDYEYMNNHRTLSGIDIDCVLLTHSHLDHCGGVPLLFKDDSTFDGTIYGSRETLNQATHILRDSAHLNYQKVYGFKSELNRAKKDLVLEKQKAERENAQPRDIASIDNAVSSIEDEESNVLYTDEEVEEAIKHFSPVCLSMDHAELSEVSLFEGIWAKFVPITHINGSTLIELKAKYEQEEYTLVFSGDVGQSNSVLYREHEIPRNPKANALVLESLHGVSEPIETLEDSIMKLRRIIKRAIKKQKTVIISAFALDRTASIIKILNDLMDEGLNIQCFLDSPLAEKELVCYMNSYEPGDSVWFNYDMGYPFKLERIHVIDNYKDHLILSKYKGPNVIITSSCMGYGGRVVDYFEQHIQDSDAIFVFPGYLPEECPSKILLEGEVGKMLEINGYHYIKKCEVFQLHGLSSHGYLPEKKKIIEAYPNLSFIFLNHGDEEIYDLAAKLIDSTDCEVIVPLYNSYHKLY